MKNAETPDEHSPPDERPCRSGHGISKQEFCFSSRAGAVPPQISVPPLSPDCIPIDGTPDKMKVATLLLLISMPLPVLLPLHRKVTAAERLQPCTPGGAVLNIAELKHSERVRHLEFTYAGSAVGLKPGVKARVWLPMPHSSEHQRIEVRSHALPDNAMVTSEKKYGNCMIFFETAATDTGRVDFSITYDVLRSEVKHRSPASASLSRSQRRLFLAPNRLVPVTGTPLGLLSGIQLPDNPRELGRVLYDRVEEHMMYDKSRPGYGTGNAVWACDSRFGNCTDYHSLFISLARSQGLPARFEIGFPVPPERGVGEIGGYHCWAFFFTRQYGWFPADISEADKNPKMRDYCFGNITENRISFSTGRDLHLVPRQSGEPLNFFIYPHIEVNGKTLPKTQMEKRFSYRDLN